MKRVSIRGQSYAVSYDMLGLALIMELSEMTFGQLLETTGRFADFTQMGGKDLRFLYNVVYAGFINGADESGEEFPLSKRELVQAVPLNGPEIVAIMQVFQEGMASAIGGDEVEEKKSRPKASKTKTG